MAGHQHDFNKNKNSLHQGGLHMCPKDEGWLLITLGKWIQSQIIFKVNIYFIMKETL